MKHLFTLLFATILSICSNGQNQDWRPVRTDGHYMYSTGANASLRAIHIDSIVEIETSTHLFGYNEFNIIDNFCFNPYGSPWFGKEIINKVNET